MPEQLSLMLEAAATIAVEPTRDVLVHGARARGVPKHKAVVHVRGVSASTLKRMLAFAEDALRYNQGPGRALDLTNTHGAGTNGPIGRGNLHADSKGVEDWHTKEHATWPHLMRALRAQREAEPRIAQARDLAEAYHYLHAYSFAYGSPADAPPALIAAIHAHIVALEGDPRQRRPHPPLAQPSRAAAAGPRERLPCPAPTSSDPRRRGTRPVSPAPRRPPRAPPRTRAVPSIADTRRDTSMSERNPPYQATPPTPSSRSTTQRPAHSHERARLPQRCRSERAGVDLVAEQKRRRSVSGSPVVSGSR